MKDGSNIVADYRWVGSRVDRLEYLNGIIRSTTFDSVGRVSEIDHVLSSTSLAKFTYEHDENDNVLYERRGHNADLYEVFSYDKRNQLVTAWYDATTSSSPTVYTTKSEQVWDGAFNLDSRIQTVYGNSPTTVTYGANARNQYVTIGSDSPTWTDNGELADDDSVQSYNYDYLGRLTKVTRGASTYTFKYDALGRRISTDFGSELRFAWAGDRIVEEITSAGTPAVNAKWVWGADPEPIRMDRGGTLSYYHANRLGSVEKLTDASGAVVESVEYEAFGKPSITSSGRGNPFGWRAWLYDYSSSLYLVLSRAMDPVASLRALAATQGSDFAAIGLRAAGTVRARSVPWSGDGGLGSAPGIGKGVALGVDLTSSNPRPMDAGVPHDPSPETGWGSDGLYHCSNGCARYNPADCWLPCPGPRDTPGDPIGEGVHSCEDCMAQCSEAGLATRAGEQSVMDSCAESCAPVCSWGTPGGSGPIRSSGSGTLRGPGQ